MRRLTNKTIYLLIYLFELNLLYGCSYVNNKTSPTQANTKIKYDIIKNDSDQSVVKLNEPLGESLNVDTNTLSLIADSLYEVRQLPKLPNQNNFSVEFYYKKDWQGKIYYAGKIWIYNYSSHTIVPQKLDITYITGDDHQDEINSAKLNKKI